MNNVPLRLSAPKLPGIFFSLLYAGLSAAGIKANIFIRNAALYGGENKILSAALFLITTVLTALAVCAFFNSVACVAEFTSIRLDNTSIKVYNIPEIKLCDIKEIVLLPQDKMLKTIMVIRTTDGRTLKIKQKFVNIPLETLFEAMKIRIAETESEKNITGESK